MTEPHDEPLPDDGLIHLNGIDALTGRPLVEPLAPEEAARLAGQKPPEGWVARWLTKLGNWMAAPFRGLPHDVAPENLAQTGWAVVFAAGTPMSVREALRPLLD